MVPHSSAAAVPSPLEYFVPLPYSSVNQPWNAQPGRDGGMGAVGYA